MWWQLSNMQIIALCIFLLFCGLGSIGGYFTGKALNKGQADHIKAQDSSGKIKPNNLIPMAVILGISAGAILGYGVAYSIRLF